MYRKSENRDKRETMREIKVTETTVGRLLKPKVHKIER